MAAASWDATSRYVADGLKRIKAEHGPQGIGALGSPHNTLEELHLLAKLTRGLGSENIDHRLRHSDFGNRARTAPRAGSGCRSPRCRRSIVCW